MYVSVRGGTHAGWRNVKQERKAWVCPTCGRPNSKYWAKCPDCKTSAPDQ